MTEKTIILANGKFPDHEIPLGYLKNSEAVVCCDGAAHSLINLGIEPLAIVGDFDSIDISEIIKYSDRFFIDKDQETNDLTKAINWCIKNDLKDIIILGATGLREDHTIGNISLLAEYARLADVKMITDTGVLMPVLKSSTITSFNRQTVSIFSIDPGNEITSSGLKFPLEKMKLKNWWMATLNESEGANFSLTFEGGPLIVYLQFPDN